ncbi:MAG: hypothetical protein AAFZ87_20510, partial [Planctomycetota bacterium]
MTLGSFEGPGALVGAPPGARPMIRIPAELTAVIACGIVAAPRGAIAFGTVLAAEVSASLTKPY